VINKALLILVFLVFGGLFWSAIEQRFENIKIQYTWEIV